MKHIENYESFTESLFNIFKTKEEISYNKTLKNLLSRVKEIFDINNLSTIEEQDNDEEAPYGSTDREFTYYLEETDSDLGYIKIVVKFIWPNEYKLSIDDKEVNNSMASKFYWLFYRFLYKEQEEKKKKELKGFTKKYNI